MPRTTFQQYQVSGSLLADIVDNLSTGPALQGKSSITGDLNAIRTQLNNIIGRTSWYDALTGSQSLKIINDAMVVNGNDATFNDKVDVLGELTASWLRVRNNLNVDGQLTSSYLFVSGTSFFSGAAVFSGSLLMPGGLEIDSELFILTGTFDMLGSASFNGDVYVTGTLTASTFISSGSVFVSGNLYDLDGDLRVSFFHDDDFKVYTDGGSEVFTIGKSSGDVTLMNDLIFGGPGDSGSIKIANDGDNLQLTSTGKLFITSSGQAFTLVNSGEQATFDAAFPNTSIIGALVQGAGNNFKQGIVEPGNKTGGTDLINFTSVGYLLTSSLATDTDKLLAMNVYLNGYLLAYGSTNDYQIIDTANVRLSTGLDTLTGDVMIFSIKNAANV